MTNAKFRIESFSYLHNIFVKSNTITDIEVFFKDVLGASEMDVVLHNLNTNNDYRYYSKDYLGVVTAISENSNTEAIFSGQLLEVLKMFFYLRLTTNLDITENLADAVKSQMHTELLLALNTRVPIITHNALNNIKKTYSYKHFKEAVDFKISYLGLLRDKKRIKNATLLNVLLYVLSFVGGVGTLQVLQTEYCIPFKISFPLLSVVFIALGIVWALRERRN
jgi:hypothetical protein